MIYRLLQFSPPKTSSHIQLAIIREAKSLLAGGVVRKSHCGFSPATECSRTPARAYLVLLDHLLDKAIAAVL